MGLHSEEFAPLKKQGFQVCDDARGDGPEQAQICCNLSGSSAGLVQEKLKCGKEREVQKSSRIPFGESLTVEMI
jgi:hypothetical protein